MDPIFSGLIDQLIDNAQTNGDAERNQELMAWFLSDLSLWSGDVLDVDAISDAFDREDVGVLYSEAIADDGTVGEAGSTKLQSDYLAMAERAFRIRHMSPIRARAQASARRTAHGDAAGCIARVRAYAQTLLDAGAAP